MQSHALATARYLGVPGPALGMAAYSLACAQVATNDPSGAAATLTEAVRLNPDLRANARRDPDVAPLRAGGQLATLLR
jgi:uncharacterized membrane protein